MENRRERGGEGKKWRSGGGGEMVEDAKMGTGLGLDKHQDNCESSGSFCTKMYLSRTKGAKTMNNSRDHLQKHSEWTPLKETNTVTKQALGGSPGVTRTVWRFKAEPVSMTSLLRPSLLHPGSGSWMEVNSHRNSSRFLQMHPRIEPRMRSILLDWMMEVSEAFTLQRHTFYLAQDYFDRFMQRQYNVQKESLQVIGATCLFLASKMEESRAVKLKQVVDVGDGAYTEQDVRRVELLILKTLGWRLSSDTALFWLELYLQLVLMEVAYDPLEQLFPYYLFFKMTRVLDLCMLHVNSMDFEYNVLAAAILSRFFHQEVVEQVSESCSTVEMKSRSSFNTETLKQTEQPDDSQQQALIPTETV
ncbi:G1/S-specific cyclin-E1-like [Sphaeramia orbicularis]|uniref:G1/S-specific cyclin-E1-like n=1 Tax=Sphaeramia orbicularis TaxID=375764 RepID=UPI0011815384|nr:G1/S-specific cyclin-E1-like [Sphaeramia orbicularis]